ncbi:RNA polymerase sigma factor [Pleionea sediminis]|uniref:RNA polymerase sigma factor n=1 Tax=Pleionea sediminis TaxID=2569479 RepID=UPI0013DDDA03|nr:sigma-70 family RNA polymerase sigma factor [Pleionea sediminis]
MSAELISIQQAKSELHQLDEWVLLAQQGDVAAFECIYKAFNKRVYALCYRMAANEALAEELMQEAFIMAWRKLPQFKGESQLGTWLHRLTSNLVISHFRVQKNQMVEGSDAELEHSGNESSRLDLKRDLERAIKGLPDKARMVFVLHDIEGFKHQEIAEQMSISEGTCKAQLHRARTLLKERLV